jgi:hypothetical protein
MTRSRLALSLAAALVGLGLATAMGVLVLAPARAAVGPLPAEGLALPAEARFLVGVDVKRLVASPLYARFAKGPGGLRPDAFKALEDKTGINPERDVRELIVAGGLGGGRQGVALVLGDFDQYQVGRALETGKKGATWKKLGGTTVYLFGEGSPSATAVSFLDKHGIVLGPAAAVESTVEGRAEGRGGLKGNTALMELLASVKPGSTFWMVGDQSLLANMPTSVPGPGSSGGSSANVTLPKLNSLTVTGDLDPVLSLDVVGGAADAAAASSLADVVRGFVALAVLQASQKPELKALQTAITVTPDGSRVRLNARFPHDLLEALAKPRTPAAAPAPGPDPPSSR